MPLSTEYQSKSPQYSVIQHFLALIIKIIAKESHKIQIQIQILFEFS